MSRVDDVMHTQVRHSHEKLFAELFNSAEIISTVLASVARHENEVKPNDA